MIIHRPPCIARWIFAFHTDKDVALLWTNFEFVKNTANNLAIESRIGL